MVPRKGATDQYSKLAGATCCLPAYNSSGVIILYTFCSDLYFYLGSPLSQSQSCRVERNCILAMVNVNGQIYPAKYSGTFALRTAEVSLSNFQSHNHFTASNYL